MSEKKGYDTDDNQCEYCGCVLRWPYNRILRHHKEDNIPICNDCIQSLYLHGDVVLNEYSRWQFKEDISSKKVGPNV
jgi:hypothetical protein